MSVNNSLAKKNQSNKVVEYDCNGNTVKMSPNIVRKFLVNGGGNVTDQEIGLYINLCKFNGLNPFLRESYLIKYGSQPAAMVVSKEAYLKRAFRNEKYKGFQAGIIVIDDNGNLNERTGMFYIAGEKVVGGWAKVYVEGILNPYEAKVSISEYVGRKKDGTPNSNWETRPATMIRKVAIVQAFREAFPESLGGMYIAEEQGLAEEAIEAESEVINSTEIEESYAEADFVEQHNESERNDAQTVLFG